MKKCIKLVLIIFVIISFFSSTVSYGICNTIRSSKRVTAVRLTLQNGQVINDFETIYYTTIPANKLSSFCNFLKYTADGYYPEGHIEAGSVNTTNYSFNPYRQGYFIGSTTNTDTLTSDIIRGLQQKRNGAYSAGTVNYQVPVGAARVIIACPATNTGMTKVINQSALNADVTDTFTETQVSVEGANGYSSTEYNVWTFTPPAVYAQVANLAITLG